MTSAPSVLGTHTFDGGIVSDRRLYLTRALAGVAAAVAGQRVVEEGSADAAYLLATPGDTIPADHVAALGLDVVDGKVVQKVVQVAPAPAPAAATSKPAKPHEK